MYQKISAIVCACNEENTIGNVIKTMLEHRQINELIVVNDGSDDGTADVIQQSHRVNPGKLKYISMPVNTGKGFAMYTGIRMSTGHILVFIDADLEGLQTYHIDQLINPLIGSNAAMVLGNPSGSFVHYQVDPFKIFTGERALYKHELMPVLPKIRNSKFGAETVINLYYWAQKKHVRQVKLEGVTHFNKFEKTSAIEATKGLTSEGQQILTTTFSNLDLFLYGLKRRFRNQLPDN